MLTGRGRRLLRRGRGGGGRGLTELESGLRLLTGENVVSLVLEHYDALPHRWRARTPLRPVLVVDDVADA